MHRRRYRCNAHTVFRFLRGEHDRNGAETGEEAKGETWQEETLITGDK